MKETKNTYAGIEFKYTFRDYQARALKELRHHLSDGKLNVIAAPGAGKTILALQVMLELNEPALILAPTVALRQQWIDRFEQDFTGIKENLISDDLQLPKTVTAATYQALYSAFAGAEKKTILASLKKMGIRVIILDEAHHLKKVWLDAVSELAEALPKVRTVSLTATPPYDIKPTLWNRYIGLCGEIDAEIPVPELVQKGDLAPHQDFVYFNIPTFDQSIRIGDFNQACAQLLDDLLHDDTLLSAVSLHPMILKPEDHMEYLLDQFDYYVVLLKYLYCNSIEAPVFSLKIQFTSAAFTLADLEILLDYCLFSDRKSYKMFDDFFREIRRRLNAIGAIAEGEVNLRHSKETRMQLAENKGKLASVSEIIDIEKASLKSSLKLVVITDHIYQNALDLREDESLPHLGVIPLFLELRRRGREQVIVLTGEMIIIPADFEQELRAICDSAAVAAEAVRVEGLALRFDYAKVVFSGNAQKKAVGIITELFRTSGVNVLIGSNAYIGEGWDAPFINTLIMASTIASFVSSNQIRGRVIRTCPAEPDKCANIWHLVCVEEDHGSYALGDDYQRLTRRFQVFEGICLSKDRIDSGIGRMDLEQSIYTPAELQALNERMAEYARNRAETTERWVRALPGYTYIREYPLTAVSDPAMIASLETRLDRIYRTVNRLTTRFLGERFGFGILRRRSLVRRMGEALLSAFVHLKQISPQVSLHFSYHAGDMVFWLKDAEFREQQLFTGAFKEMMNQPANPRYLMYFRKAYFQIPAAIGKTKAGVEYLAKQLSPRRVPLLYTRTPEGRRKLLEIRLNQSGIDMQWNERNDEEANTDNTRIDLQVLKDKMQVK